MADSTRLPLRAPGFLGFFLAKNPKVISYSPAHWVVMATYGRDRGALLGTEWWCYGMATEVLLPWYELRTGIK